MLKRIEILISKLLVFAMCVSLVPNTIAFAGSTDSIQETVVNMAQTTGAAVRIASVVNVTGITLNSTSLSLVKGNTSALVATVSPSNASNKTVTWKTSNSKVATVNSSGNVNAVGAGTATITCTASDGSGKSATCTVTVTNPVLVTNIILSSISLSIVKGNTSTLTATIAPSNASNKTVTWKTSNSNVATVNSSGNVTAVGVGTATITCTASDGSGKSATCTVTVTNPVLVTDITLSSTSLSIVKGNTSTLTATIAPSNASNKTVTWKTSNSNVTTVNSSGNVTAVGVGTATITCTVSDGSGKSATCGVTVTSQILATGITLNNTSLNLIQGNTSKLTATVSPSNASNNAVTWTTSDSSIATVDASGNVTAVGSGTAIITCAANDGSGVFEWCSVIVPNLVTGITLSSKSLILEKGGGTSVLTATISPSNASNKRVTWTTSDSNVVTVDASGNVTAVGSGTATITCEANDGSGKSATCTVTSRVLVTSIALSSTSLSIEKGTTAMPGVTIAPSDADNKAVTWMTSDSNVVTVDASGSVTAVGAGTATITCTASDGSGKSVVCTVTVPNSLISESGFLFDSTTGTISYFHGSCATVIIPSSINGVSVTSIGDNTFGGNENLTSVIIPNSVTSIGNRAFERCIALTNITIPNSVTSIGNWTFDECSSLTSITLPDSITSMGYGEFFGCSKLTSIKLPNSTISIGENTFTDCSSLINITIPNSVTSIGTWAFYNCSSLTSITLPDNITSIEQNAFNSCRKLTSITIPNSVTSIGKGAFNYCGTPLFSYNDNIIFLVYSDNTKQLLINYGISESKIIFAITSITLDNTSINLEKGSVSTLTAIVLPSNASNKNLTWISGNTDVATVDVSGKVTAVGAGTATITCTASDGSGKSATCTVTVTSPILATGITLSSTSLSLEKGSTSKLTATVSSSNAGVTWTTSDSNIATVDVNGNVTAVGVGAAIITCSAADGSGITATCDVIVTEGLVNIQDYLTGLNFNNAWSVVDSIRDNTLRIQCNIRNTTTGTTSEYVDADLPMTEYLGGYYAKESDIIAALGNYLKEKSNSGIYARQWAAEELGIFYDVDGMSQYNVFGGKNGPIDITTFINQMGPQWELNYLLKTNEDRLNEMQQAIDICSCIPVIFVPAQGANILISFLRGNTKDALIRAGLLGTVSIVNKVVSVAVEGDLATNIANCGDDTASMKSTFEEAVEAACFTAGTLVLTNEGLKPIEDIKIGDYVWSENPITYEKGLKRVVNTFVHNKNKLIHIYAGNTLIETTETHPFWIEGKGWTAAGKIKAGDILRLQSGKNISVSKVEAINLDSIVKVYNFEVEDWHTYYVSDEGVLVHNTCAETNLPEYLEQLEKKPQVVINKEVGTAFEYYVEGGKLANIDYDIQDLYGILDRETGDLVQVQPDFTLKSLTTGDKVAFADAKTALTGSIPYDAQFKRLVWLTEQESTTKTLIYYVPTEGNYISDTMVAFADRYGVRILQVVAE